MYASPPARNSHFLPASWEIRRKIALCGPAPVPTRKSGESPEIDVRAVQVPHRGPYSVAHMWIVLSQPLDARRIFSSWTKNTLLVWPVVVVGKFSLLHHTHEFWCLCQQQSRELSCFIDVVQRKHLILRQLEVRRAHNNMCNVRCPQKCQKF